MEDSILILYAEIGQEDYDELMQIFLPKFSFEFQERIYRYRRKEDRLLTLTGRKLLSQGLKLLNVNANIFNLEYNTWGMPFLTGNLIKFNISHSYEVAVCALTMKGEIGIDIEHWEDIPAENFRKVFSELEWNSIQADPDTRETFYRYWTQKEAVLKAHGEGFNIPINSVKLHGQTATLYNKEYHLTEIKICPNYSCHLANSTGGNIRLYRHQKENADIQNAAGAGSFKRK
jgi:4'-phosphopantetheinyl transferase